jgi:ketosteroid isomerase-like protein
MSEEYVRLTRRALEALDDGDVEAAVGVCHPEIEFLPLRAALVGAYRGHEGLREFFADTAESFELFHVEIDEVRDLGDRVLALGALRVRTSGGGPEATTVLAAVTEFRDGLLVRVEDFGDRARAFEAAGLEA